MSLFSQSTPNRRPVCNFFRNGNCKKGERCTYLHEGVDTPGSPSSPSPRRNNDNRRPGRGNRAQQTQGRQRQDSEASSAPINQGRQRQNSEASSTPINQGRQRQNSEASSATINQGRQRQNSEASSATINQGRQRKNSEASSAPINPPSPAPRQRGGLNARPAQQTFQRGDGWSKCASWMERFTGMKQGALQMRYFWEEALDIVEGLDPNLIQKVVERLVERDNIGRQLIEQVVNHDYSGPRSLDYLLASIPFLLFLTHPELINSLSINRQVGTLYNYLYGTDGSMCVKFFHNIAGQLEKESATEDRKSGVWKSAHLGKPASFSKALASAVEGLRHTLKRNQHAGFNEEYKTAAESFCILANLVPQYDAFYPSITSSLKEVIGIHRRANLIIVVPTPPPASQDTDMKAVQSSFPIDIDFPGYLSEKGVRHDNDSVSICDISLLPTLDEILSERKDFLPYKDLSHPHFLTGVDRLFDTHFRLFRHDNVAGIKDSVGMVFDLFQLPPRERAIAFKNATRRNLQGNLYDDVDVVWAKFDKMKGLELVLRFQQPAAIIKKSPKKQMKWWDDQKKRLDRGTLACLVTSNQDFRRVTFLTISRKETNPDSYNSLAAGKYGHVFVQVAESKMRAEDVDFILERLSPLASPMKNVLLEFPGIIPATFIPVLKNLQELSDRGTLPLSQWIAPSPEGMLPGSTVNNTDSLPPAYSRGAEFRWDLKPILKNRSTNLFLSPTAQPDDEKILDNLEEMTTLDRGQCKAFITGLTKEMSLIQGPPGTGKSYVGVQLVNVLLHNKKFTKIGPIICVCYTNHALDQFLEELMKKGVSKIIRVGGQSKSTELEGRNLQAVGRAEKKTASERNNLARHHQNLEGIQKEADRFCREVSRRPGSWAAIRPIMERDFPELYNQFSGDLDLTDQFALLGVKDGSGEELEEGVGDKDEEDDSPENIEEVEDDSPKDRLELSPKGKKQGKGINIAEGILGEDSSSEDEELEVDESPKKKWEQVSSPQEVWDGWRGVRRNAAWDFRNANAFDDPYPARTLEEIAECEDIWSMPWAERDLLVEHLSRLAAASPVARLAMLTQGQAVEISELNSQHHEVDRRCLEQADVIGVTTTGLAKQVALLSRVNAKVVICEEAGEVLEAHLINAILPTCQHLIQIGDHQQLRPQINTHALSLESRGGKVYSLDESMFERLVNERSVLKPAQLNIQRRMRPGISSLIRDTLYPNLRDHPTVEDYPDVVGMRKNIFWLDHVYPEAKGDDSGQVKSHSNDWEVRMTHGLVRHLIRQSHYDSKDIAVLTPYTGQLQKLRLELKSSFEVVLSERDEEALARDGLEDGEEPEEEQDPRGITVKKANLLDVLRVATVDNFQGEEAKVVVISLVRSNDEGKIGFLKTTNRINVLLSRAKHGMYIIGNSASAASIPMWRDVCQMLRDNDAIGTQLALVCPRHRNTPIQVEEPEDFLRLSPEGGCDLICDKRLDPCGHRCFSKCHSDGMHKAVSCSQPCIILHPICQHPCQRLCSENCGRCMMPIYDFLIPCGHFEEEVQCWQTRKDQYICCRKSVMKRVPGCGHLVKVACWVDVKSPDYKCSAPCDYNLLCGHTCTGTCGLCNKIVDGQKQTDHGNCKKPCGREFTTCNHRCRKFCHDGTPCGLCDAQCDVKCEHSNCHMKCQESCAPCAEPCAWKCKHQGECRMPCAAPCERFPCNERCDENLACGHRCPAVCGEICPGVDFCQICCSEERKEDPGVDMVEFSPYSTIDLDENPILVLSCGHFFTRETLDGYLELYGAYSMGPMGDFDGYIDPEGVLDEETPKCPSCRHPLLQFSVRRYGRVVNRAAIMEMTRRFLASTSSRYKGLSDALSTIERDLMESRDNFFTEITSTEANNTQAKKGLQLKDRLKAINQIVLGLSVFLMDVKDQRQPATKLYQSTITLKTSLNLSETEIAATVYFRPDTRLELLAKILKIRSTLLDVTERTLLAHHLRSKDKSSSAIDNMSVFIDLISRNAQTSVRKAFGTCREIIADARAQNLPRAEIEAISLFAKLAAIWRQLPQDHKLDKNFSKVVEEATIRLDRADEICEEEEFGGVEDMKEMLVTVRRQLDGGTFYQDVSEQEMAAVVKAMKAELSVSYAPTGHWYYCQNGHPFTVGECGLPMEEMKCPECNAPVGGRRHNPASGVQSAAALEAIASRV